MVKQTDKRNRQELNFRWTPSALSEWTAHRPLFEILVALTSRQLRSRSVSIKAWKSLRGSLAFVVNGFIIDNDPLLERRCDPVVAESICGSYDLKLVVVVKLHSR